MATTIRIALAERSYDIEIARGNLENVAAFLSQRTPCSHVVIVTDRNVAPLLASEVARRLAAAGTRTDVVQVPAGEGSKSIAEAERLWNELARLKADRKTVVVALGGGVVGDLAGFVAATYSRGLPFVQIPTTLLAQVDSSVGGKVGINLAAGKNMVGAFWQPLGVLIDLDVLKSLPEREYRCGLAEVVKYGVILDADFFAFLEERADDVSGRDVDVLEKIIARSCRLKADVVERDERETTGLRAVLNYGHTFGHAIEAATGYGRFLHGEAVAIGMICASRLAEQLGRIDAAATQRQIELLRHLGLPVAAADLDKNTMMEAMHHDKKSECGQLRFVLPSRIGFVELVGGIEKPQIRQALDSALSMS